MSSFQIGQIVWLDLGSKEKGEVKGHEQAKERPCLIINALNHLKLLIIIPLSTKEPKNPYFYNIVKISKEKSPLKEDSYALCHQIRTVSIQRVASNIGVLSDSDLDVIRYTIMDLIHPI